MSTRREFLGNVGLAGLCFVGCNLLAPRASHAQGRRMVKVAGKRARVIDVHAHVAVAEALELAGLKLGEGALRPDLAVPTTLDQRIAAMDAQGIDIEALSINAFWYGKERDLAAKICELQNERLAEVCAKHADRFVAFATVALQFPELAAEQLEQAVKKYHLRGAAIGGSVAGLELANPKFDPFWARAEALGAVIFIHPQGMGDLNGRFKGNGMLGNVIGNPLETTIALSHLIFEGTLDRFPGLKICAAHGGGYLPSYMHRSDHGCMTFPEQCTAGTPRKAPTEYVKQMYFDSLVFTPEALRHLVAEVGADRIMLGTDYPYPWVSTAVDHVLRTASLSDRDREAILGGTAARLLGLPPRIS
ncbi:MAG TPA: amidohydrolase family protein [Kofleriaceae bacterium]